MILEYLLSRRRNFQTQRAHWDLGKVKGNVWLEYTQATILISKEKKILYKQTGRQIKEGKKKKKQRK